MYYWGGGQSCIMFLKAKAYDKLGEPGIMLHCAKHNQHAQHANARGVWGHAPPRKILKIRCSEIEYEGISGSKYLYNLKKQIIVK